MKASVHQLVFSGLALGLMAGAVGLHWHDVGQDASLGEFRKPPVVVTDSTVPAGPIPVSWVVEPSSGAIPRIPATGPSSPEMGATVEALNEIVSVLRELKDENRDLREQVKEANRDLTEMQFRLDTHSKSFRPLKVGSEPAAPLDTGASHPLLPPKRRN